MNYQECCKLVDFLNKKVPFWYLWLTAEPWDWNKCERVAKKLGFNPLLTESNK